MSNDRGDHHSQSWPWPSELDALVAAPNSHRLLLDHAAPSRREVGLSNVMVVESVSLDRVIQPGYAGEPAA